MTAIGSKSRWMASRSHASRWRRTHRFGPTSANRRAASGVDNPSRSGGIANTTGDVRATCGLATLATTERWALADMNSSAVTNPFAGIYDDCQLAHLIHLGEI